MNYLGHIALAAPHTHLMAGGMLGDHIKGRLPAGLPQPLAQGVQLHRLIDGFSDRHAALGTLREQLPAHWFRFAGILLDLYTDHLLAREPEQYLGEPLERFSNRSLDKISAGLHHVDGATQKRFDLIRQQNWLCRYADASFTSACLERIGQRIRFGNPLHQASQILEQHCDVLDVTSRRIYHDSQQLVAKWLAENREPPAEPAV